MNSEAKTSNMKKKRNKNKLNVFVLVFVVIFMCAGFVSVKREVEIASKKKELAEVQQKIELEKKRGDELTAQLKEVETPEYMEKLAREKLGYARSNEIIYYDASLKK